MPQEKKKRGRRAQDARRKAEEAEQPVKFAPDVPLEYYDVDEENANPEPNGSYDGMPFFGLLDEQEQEYFRTQDELLKANNFESDEDRNVFITNFFKETDGKELKLASSQGCSRLLERMITLATPSQLKNLFQKCNGNFIHLIQHRFASHFCESLFVHAAPVVSEEVGGGVSMDVEGDEVFASMESLFLFTLIEIEPSLHSLLSHPFASHTVRVLLLVLSGQGINGTSSGSLIQSKKKENQLETGKLAEERKVPDSFREATTRVLSAVQEKMGVRELRILAVHPVGSPTLQFLLRLELADTQVDNKRNTLLKKLLSGEEDEGDSSAASFLQNLFYDSVGSHLLESIVQSANKKTFDELYDTYFRGRIASLARNDTASFIAQRVVERLDGKQLEAVLQTLVPLVLNLLERSLTSVLKAAIDGCNRHGTNADQLVKAILDTYNGNVISVVIKMLKLSEQELRASDDTNTSGTGSSSKKKNPAQMHGSLLAQSILQLPGDLGAFINDSLLAQPSATLVVLAEHPAASHLIQTSLISPHATVPHKRKILNNLSGSFARLSMNGCGSHLVDACWTATVGMNNYRQRIAEELLAKEPEIRASLFGKIVWRNWRMDKYKTRRGEWFSLGKAEDPVNNGTGTKGLALTGNGASTFTDTSSAGVLKTAIQLARERRAAQRKKQEESLARANYKSRNNATGSGGRDFNKQDAQRHAETLSTADSDASKATTPLGAINKSRSTGIRDSAGAGVWGNNATNGNIYTTTVGKRGREWGDQVRGVGEGGGRGGGGQRKAKGNKIPRYF